MPPNAMQMSIPSYQIAPHIPWSFLLHRPSQSNQLISRSGNVDPLRHRFVPLAHTRRYETESLSAWPQFSAYEFFPTSSLASFRITRGISIRMQIFHIYHWPLA